MENNQHLGNEKIGVLMRKYAVPCIISLLVGALYNIVDQIFIANASYLGSFGNAANTVVFPLTVIALAIAVMIGDGCCAFVSLSLGRREAESAKKSVGNSIIMVIVSSLILSAAYLIFSKQIISLFGGTVNSQTFKHSKEYFFYITLGIPFYMFGVGFALLLPLFFGLDGVLYSMPLSDILTFVISAIIIFKVNKELNDKTENSIKKKSVS